MAEQHGEWTTGLQTYDYGEGHYWSGGNHGVELIQAGICTMVPKYEWTKIYFTGTTHDTDGFFDTAIPGCLIVPASGFYVCSLSIGWPVTGRTATDLSIEIRSAIWNTIAYDNAHPAKVDPTYMCTFGQGILEQGEEIGAYVRNGTGNIVTLLQEGILCPRLTVQWAKNFYGVIP